MKEAAGEANLTVIAIVLIGVVAAVVTPMITGLMSSQSQKACCQSHGGVWDGGECEGLVDPSGYTECTGGNGGTQTTTVA